MHRCSVEGEGYRCEPRHGYKARIDGEFFPSDHYTIASDGKRLDRINECVDLRDPDIIIRGPDPMIYRQVRQARDMRGTAA